MFQQQQRERERQRQKNKQKDLSFTDSLLKCPFPRPLVARVGPGGWSLQLGASARSHAGRGCQQLSHHLLPPGVSHYQEAAVESQNQEWNLGTNERHGCVTHGAGHSALIFFFEHLSVRKGMCCLHILKGKWYPLEWKIIQVRHTTEGAPNSNTSSSRSDLETFLV